MIREIVTYGHPALRARGRKVENIDDRIRSLARDMLETMEDAQGVGLAAQQIGLPLQLCVLDVRGVRDRPSRMWLGGREVDPEGHMPLVLVNPEVELSGEQQTGVEGCLSFPGLTADIERPGRVRVRALDLEGRPVEFEAEGLLARAVQHEHDHLQGILFIDRMSERERERIQPKLEQLLRKAGRL